jgi:hypothetical protein
VKELKYIIVRTDTGEHPIVFPKEVMHRDVARIHSATNGPWVVSAGFCRINSDSVKAYGESESLRGMKSRPQDSEILEESLL